MKKYIVLLILISISAQVFSQKLEKTLLWEISGNGLKKPSYIYGTIHASCEQDVVLTPALKNALQNTDQLYLELDMDDPGLQMEMMSHMLMKDGVTLQNLVSEQDFQLASTKFAEMTGGLPLASLSSVKPLLLTAFMLPSMLDCKTTSWEEFLMENIKAQKKEVYGLEKVTEQLSVFDSIPYQVQADEMMSSLKGEEKDKKELEQMLKLYAEKDIEGLHKFMHDSSPMMGTYEDVLLDSRNKNWVKLIPGIVSKNATIFAVGAGHLAGKNGVVNLLRAKGFTVSAVK